MYLRRIRGRYGENGANDVPAGLAFVEPARFGQAASVANGRDNQLFAEWRPATTPKQRATNLGKGWPHQKTVRAKATAQQKGVGSLTEEQSHLLREPASTSVQSFPG